MSTTKLTAKISDNGADCGSGDAELTMHADTISPLSRHSPVRKSWEAEVTGALRVKSGEIYEIELVLDGTSLIRGGAICTWSDKQRALFQSVGAPVLSMEPAVEVMT